MLEIPCSICQKATRLQHLRSWRGTHPVCSERCLTAADELAAPPEMRPCATAAFTALSACKPILDHAIVQARIAAHNECDKEQLDSEEAGLGVLMTGVVGAAIIGSKLNTATTLHREATYGVLMALQQLEPILLSFVRNMMGLHGLGVPVAADLQPLVTDFSIFKVQPDLLPSKRVHQELLQLHQLLSHVHVKLTRLLQHDQQGGPYR